MPRRIALALLVLLWPACSDDDDRPAPDAGVDSGAPDACPSCAIDASFDAGEPDSAPEDAGPRPLAEGGCQEILTTNLKQAERIAGTPGIDSLADGFVLASFRDWYDGPCLIRRYDLDGEEVSSFEFDAGSEGCTEPITGPDGQLLFVDPMRNGDGLGRIWAGDIDGEGEWRQFDRDLTYVELPGTRAAKLGEAGVAVEWSTWKLLRLSWEGEIVAEWRPWLPGIGDVGSAAIASTWNGDALGVAWTGDYDGGRDEVWFQRLDVNLEPLDPEPTLVVEFSWEENLQFVQEEPLVVGWDGTRYAIPVFWFEGRGEWGEAGFLDVFVLDEQGQLEGHFPFDRFARDAYHATGVMEILSLPDRVALFLDSEYWTADPDGNPLATWHGIDVVPLGLTEQARVADDGRLHIKEPMAKSGNRLGFAWVTRNYVPGEGWEDWETLYFTVLDCTAAFEGR